MFLIKIVNFLKGYVIIQADGYFLERFINICMRRGLLLWDMKKPGDTRMRAKITIADFRQLRGVAQKTKTRVKIVRKRGLPFVLHRYRSRRPAVVGLILAAIMLWYFANFVTGVVITGNERITEPVLLTELRGFGVDLGRSVRRINTDLLENKLMTKMPDLSWVGVTVKGSKVYVDVRERAVLPPRVDKNLPCNIVAARAGVIELPDVRWGQTVVAVGQAVAEGDLLVSGLMDSRVEGITYIHAAGDVYAYTSYKESIVYPLELQEKVDTGVTKRRYSIRFMKFNMNFYLNSRIPFAVYEKTASERQINLWDDFLPTIFWIKQEYREQNIVNTSRTAEDVMVLANEELPKLMDSAVPETTEVLNKNLSYVFLQNGDILAEMEYECRENIAREVEIQL